MGHDANSQFLKRFSVIEENLLALDSSSLNDFNKQWTDLVDDLRVAMDLESLNNTTVTIAHSLANRVSFVIQSFLHLEILAQSHLSSPDETSSTFSTTSPTPHSEHLDSASSYIKPSYDWLVKNIHNPYPSSRVRDDIALNSGTPRKDIDNWFIDARKRIGWNAARKAHFSNKRVDIVDAATRFYADDDKLSLSQDAELALVAIMKNAKDLYSDKFDESPLAANLGTMGKDLTPSIKSQAEVEKNRDVDPSPKQTQESSCLPAVPREDEVEIVASRSISTTNRKRRSSSSETSDIQGSSRHTKRTRLDMSPSPSQIKTFTICLPPASSGDEPIESMGSSISSPLHPLGPAVASRKRRLSDSDGETPPKRPRELGPHPQTVSNPLFDESSFDGWFQRAFDCPEICEISTSGFSVELGSLSDFDCDTPAVTRSATPENTELTEHNPQTIEVADTPSLLDMQYRLDYNCWTDNLFEPSLVTPSSFFVNFPGQETLPTSLAHDLSDSQSFLHKSHLSSVLESSRCLSNVNTGLVSAANESWDFTVSALMPQDTACNFSKHGEDFGANTALLSTFDYPLGDLLPSLDAISLSQDKVRQEKEKEYREAMEKASRLAFELREAGIVL